MGESDDFLVLEPSILLEVASGPPCVPTLGIAFDFPRIF